MSGSDYAHCAHCGTKAFYDADTEIGSAVVFHDKCLPKHDAAAAAKALREVADEINNPSRTPDLESVARAVVYLRDRADQIEREAGESDADA